MELRILGPIELWAAGRPIGIPGTRQQKLLALLVLSANQVIPDGQLIGDLWEDPPQSARQQVHNAVGSLRRTLEALGEEVRITRTDLGYRLDVPPNVVDAYRFSDTARQARAAGSAGRIPEAIELFEAALRLWRGHALAGLEGDTITSAAANLDEQRLSAIEDLISHRLRAGEAASLVAELRQLVADHPLRESLRSLLMQALHLSSRQADALAVYDEGRRILAGDLGIDPGPDLRRLHAVILSGDADPDDVVPGRTPPDDGLPHSGDSPPSPALSGPARRFYLPHDIGDFSGRSAELAHLLSTTRDTSPTALVISAIDGMGGVGKTTLAVHLAHQIAEHYPDGQYFVDLHGFSPGLEPVAPEQALDTLLRGSGVPPELVPPQLEARSALWRSQMAGQRALLVLDNAIDADHVRPLLPGTAGVLVLVTSRRKLTTLDGAVPMSLDVLTRDDAIALFEQVAGRDGRDDADEVATVAELCGRLPLAIRIAAARLRSRPHWTIADLTDRLRNQSQRARFLAADDRSVISVLRLSYRYLRPEQQLVFRLLGAHPGIDFDAYLVAAISGLSHGQAEYILESLFDDNLVKQRSSKRFYFHDLVKDCARQILGELEDGNEHQLALERLLDYYLHCAAMWCEYLDSGAGGAAVQVKHPPRHVKRVSSSDEAVDALNLEYSNLLSVAKYAAENNWLRHAWQLPCVIQPLMKLRNNYGGSAFSLFQGALRAARGLRDSQGESTCLQGLAAICRERKSPNQAKDYIEQALKISRDLGDRRAEAEQLVELGNLHLDEDRLREGRDAFVSAEQLISFTPKTFVRAAIANNLGVIYRDLGQFDLALRYLNRAIGILADDSHPRRRALTSWCIAAVLHYRGDHRQAIELFGKVLEASTKGRFEHGRAVAMLGFAEAHRSLGDLSESVEYGRAALSLSRKFDLWKVECEALNVLGEANLALNDIDQARQVFDHAREQAVLYGSKRYEARALEGLAHVASLQREITTAKERWEQAIELYPDGMVDAEFARAHLESLRLDTRCFRCSGARTR
ncbi:tetratricopeptide repeat protein [Amycolatopsis roodepoortensis]|uniref:AfsR/SARP family transcriptional regulator n=1 Tax=Amycolatopsis roodepoortensis TaxID=700274 RepID=UPI00214B542D|nr:BTAD domain-containing putative transcriptional regulator [Amycolatopsis roodepoortensis]UUV31572.1 tetratricopeptide repeat protein [Amycolatopsis roodepoortensis]